jgi:hypothetical protein
MNMRAANRSLFRAYFKIDSAFSKVFNTLIRVFTIEWRFTGRITYTSRAAGTLSYAGVVRAFNKTERTGRFDRAMLQ